MACRAKYVVEKKEQLKRAAIIHAEGEYEAAKLMAGVSGEAAAGLVALRKLDASLEIAKTLASNPNVFYAYKEMPKIISFAKTEELEGEANLEDAKQ